jgi:ketosteroid isomerase-like protein
MSTQDNVQVAKDFFAAIGNGDKHALRALIAEDFEWIIPGDWAWAGTHRGHAGLVAFLQRGPETVEISTSEFHEFVAQGDRVIVFGVATGRVKATERTFEDHFVFSITVRSGKVTHIREYIDTLALAQASGTATKSRP